MTRLNIDIVEYVVLVKSINGCNFHSLALPSYSLLNWMLLFLLLELKFQKTLNNISQTYYSSIVLCKSIVTSKIESIDFQSVDN